MAGQVSEEQQKQAEEVKNEANRLFGENKFPEALALYSRAIELNPNVAVYYSNRAFAYTKMEQYGAAIEDASKAIQVDPTYAKAYYRRGSAFMLLGKHKEALNDFRHVAKAHPTNKEARDKLLQCEKGAFVLHFVASFSRSTVIKALRFAEAIGVEIENPFDHMEQGDIEPGYDGVHIPATGVDLQFVKDLVQSFKNNKKLHRKYVHQILFEIRKQLMQLPTLVSITVPDDGVFTVCGDVHGQFYDLCHIFDINDYPSDSNPYCTCFFSAAPPRSSANI